MVVFPKTLWPSMVSELDFLSSGLGSSPSQGHYIVILGKTLYFQSTSLHPDASMGRCLLFFKSGDRQSAPEALFEVFNSDVL